MITKLELIEKNLTWQSGTIQHSRTIGDSTFIHNDSTILIMNEGRTEVIAVDENNNIVSNLSNSEELFLMYLQKHPKFGLSVVVSIKDINNHWSDKYLSLTGNKFDIMSNSR